MATYNELAYDVLEILKNNQISDDVDISLDHILFHYDTQRALWVRNEYNKPGRHIDPHLIQDLGCLKIIEVDAAECCSVNLDCIVLRTEKKLPPFLELHSGAAVTRVGPVHKFKTPFVLTTLNQIPYIGVNKYSNNLIYVVFKNDYLYLFSQNTLSNLIEYINVQGLLANPRDAISFACTTEGTPCFSYDDEYPINNWMIPYVKEQVLNQFGMSLKIPKDSDNNAKDNISKP